jgi:hypothetical protein
LVPSSEVPSRKRPLGDGIKSAEGSNGQDILVLRSDLSIVYSTVIFLPAFDESLGKYDVET